MLEHRKEVFNKSVFGAPRRNQEHDLARLYGNKQRIRCVVGKYLLNKQKKIDHVLERRSNGGSVTETVINRKAMIIFRTLIG